MLPDFSYRMENLVKAMESMIIPALPKSEAMAHEQAALVIGHIKMLEKQWNYAYVFEKLAYQNLLALGYQLSRIAAEDHSLRGQKQCLDLVLQQQPDDLPDTPKRLQELLITVGKAIDAFINDSNIVITGDVNNRLYLAILAHSAVHSACERVWFSGNNLDPEKDSLDTIDVMLSSEKYRYNPE